jgi:hypothetical protein
VARPAPAGGRTRRTISQASPDDRARPRIGADGPGPARNEEGAPGPPASAVRCPGRSSR